MHAQTANATLDGINARLDVVTQSLAYLVERQKKQEEMIAEFMPILKEVMAFSTEKLDSFEKAGYFDFARQLGAIGTRVMQSYTAEDVRLLGEATVNILNTVRAFTQPPVLGVMNEAADVLTHSETVQPLGVMGMVRATKNTDVQKGMAVMLKVLRHVGRATETLHAQQLADPRTKRRAGLQAATASRRKVLGVERSVTPVVPMKPVRIALEAVPPPSAAVMLDGVAFNPDGHLQDPMTWNETLAGNVAQALGVTLEEAHWKVVRFAREEFLKSKQSPNIRRITQATGMATKELYALFPKAPGRTVAKIAGIPKPAGCL